MTEEEDRLWGIIFVSSASQRLTVEEMTHIIKEVKSDCLSKDISGILVRSETNILCFIEGSKSSVSLHYSQILKDVRHKDQVNIFNHSTPYRYFEDFGITFHFLGEKAFKPLDDFNTDAKSAYLEFCLSMDDIAMKRISEFIKNNKPRG
jgi:hypothetical protein